MGSSTERTSQSKGARLAERARYVALALRGSERETALAQAKVLRAQLLRRIGRKGTPEAIVLDALGLAGLEPERDERQRAMSAIEEHARALGCTQLGAEAWLALSEHSWSEGRRKRCRDATSRARSIAKALGLRPLLARTEIARARWAINASAIEEARAAAERALALAEEDDRALEAQARLVLAMVDSLVGAPAAVRHARRALLLASDLEHPELEVMSFAVLGGVLVERGELVEAKPILERARQLAQQVGAHQQEFRAITFLALAELDLGHPLQASVVIADASEIADALGQRVPRGIVRGLQGIIHLVRGQYSAATRALSEGELLLEEIGNRYTRAGLLGFLGATEALCGRVREARAAFETARTLLGEGAADAFVGLTSRVLEQVLALAEGSVTAARLPAELERIAPPDPPPASVTLRIALAWVRRVGSRERTDVPTDEARSGLVVGASSAWFRIEGGAPVKLQRRPTLRRLLARLVDERLALPGSAVSRDELIAHVWPSDAGLSRALLSNRLYVAIRSLRALGLGEMIVRSDGGYRLRAELPLVVDPSRSTAESGD